MKKTYRGVLHATHALLLGSIGMVLPLGLAVVASCKPSAESRIEAVATKFSKTYFNWQFHRSVDYCTPESRKWLSYMASQVSQNDVDILRALPEGASCEVGNVAYADNDTTATVEVMVSDFLQMDTIGMPGRMVAQARFRIPLVLRGDAWKVSLTAPLRAEKP